MSKKKQPIRANIPQETLARARAELAGSPPAATSVVEGSAPIARAARPAPPMRTAATTIDDLHSEYSYVIRDLRSMAILAGILFVALIVVALIVI